MLDLKTINVRLGETTKSENFVRKEEGAMELVLPEKVVEEKSEMTVVYCTQSVDTNRIEIMSEDDIEEYLGTIMNMATSVGRGNKYGIVEVKSATKEEATSHPTIVLCSEKATSLLAYKGRRSVCIRTGIAGVSDSSC